MLPIGRMNKWVELQRVARVAGPDGYVETWTTYAESRAAVDPATPRSIESLTSATITSPVSHLVTLPYVAGVLASDRVWFKTRALYIAGMQNTNEDDRELVLACEERGA